MEKEYIPSRKQCYACSRVKVYDKDAPMHYIGFRGKPQRWAFCDECFHKWMGYSNQTGMGCPRKKIFKVVAGKELPPPMMRRDDQWLMDLAALPKEI